MENEDDRVAIREELSTMSFEEILKLKEEIGCRVYSEAVCGRKTPSKIEFKRANKNRPREISSKLPVIDFAHPKKKDVRDPRFDPLCGTFNEKAFRNAYSFVNDIRSKEKELLRRQLKKVSGPVKREKIVYLLQRMENQEREEQRRKKKEEKQQIERQEQIELLKQGKRPWFKKKSEKRVLELVDQYEVLKQKGKLQKHIEKQRKKFTQKARKKMFESNE